MTMPTIVNPGSSSPIVHYNASGTTIDTITAGAGQGSVVITQYSGHTIVIPSPGDGPEGSGTAVDLTLPSTAQIGDVVEIYIVSAVGGISSYHIWPPNGEIIAGSSTNAASGTGRRFTKLTATAWGA